MSATPRVFVPNLGQLLLLKTGRQLDQRRPQPAVDVRDLAVHELADQDLLALTERLCHTKDFVALRVAPPATSDRAACNGFSEAWNWPARGLKHYSMPLHERQPFCRIHVIPRGKLNLRKREVNLLLV